MPSRQLQGLVTDSGWTIFEHISDSLGSGGNFCTRYLARSQDGQIGFMKAMDLTRAAGDINSIKRLIDEYIFEQSVSEQCRGLNLSRIASAIESGEIDVPGFDGLNGKVYYLIFDKAEGDFRQSHIEAKEKAWLHAFKALHHVSIGISQLHRAGIAHQDIKPSNILSYSDETFKISDLGRVTDIDNKSPFSNMRFTGDTSYNPPEYLHGSYRLSEFRDRYLSDVFMLGSLAYHIVEDVQIISPTRMEAEQIYGNPMVGLPYQEALPIWMTAFSTVLERFHLSCTEKFGGELARLIRDLVEELCTPDVSLRGKNIRKPGLFNVERYVGKTASIVRQVKVDSV